MRAHRPIDPDHQQVSGVLRTIGPLLAGLGLLCLVVGVMDFFGSMGSFHPPTRIWLVFVGMPLLAIGMGITKFAYLGRIARYMSQEITPVATDTFNYAARETSGGIREVARAVGEGLRGVGPTEPACTRCGKANDADARFCSQCGAPMTAARACPGCTHENDADARFCDNCGQALTA
jgi:hypothetical protein